MARVRRAKRSRLVKSLRGMSTLRIVIGLVTDCSGCLR
jgi:hypothetical protein